MSETVCYSFLRRARSAEDEGKAEPGRLWSEAYRKEAAAGASTTQNLTDFFCVPRMQLETRTVFAKSVLNTSCRQLYPLSYRTGRSEGDS